MLDLDTDTELEQQWRAAQRVETAEQLAGIQPCPREYCRGSLVWDARERVRRCHLCGRSLRGTTPAPEGHLKIGMAFHQRGKW